GRSAVTPSRKSTTSPSPWWDRRASTSRTPRTPAAACVTNASIARSETATSPSGPACRTTSGCGWRCHATTSKYSATATARMPARIASTLYTPRAAAITSSSQGIPFQPATSASVVPPRTSVSSAANVMINRSTIRMALLNPSRFLGLFLRFHKVDALHVDVDHDHLQARHALDSPLDALLDLPGHFRDSDAVLDDDEQVDGRLLLAYFDPHALGQILVAQQLRDAAHDAAAHACDALHFGRGQPGDNRHHLVSDAELCQIAALSLVCHVHRLHA